MIEKIKKRLSTISKTSLRYRFVNTIFSDFRINNAKACSFYWLYMPSAALILFIGSICLGIFALLGWFTGHYVTFIHENEYQHQQKNEMFYKYKFNPIRGKKMRFAPWQYVVYALGIFFVFSLIRDGAASELSFDFVGNFAGWLGDHTRIIVGFVLGAVFFSLLGWVIRHNSTSLRNGWDKACPPLQVQE